MNVIGVNQQSTNCSPNFGMIKIPVQTGIGRDALTGKFKVASNLIEDGFDSGSEGYKNCLVVKTQDGSEQESSLIKTLNSFLTGQKSRARANSISSDEGNNFINAFKKWVASTRK